MPNHTSSYAKNIIRNALFALVSKELTAKQKKDIWEYFEAKCAYCRIEIGRTSRMGHMDHLISKGSNHISNRVLSCHICNGDSKRDIDWKGFLERRCGGNQRNYKSRLNRISHWIRRNTGEEISKALHKMTIMEIEKMKKEFDLSVNKIKKFKEQNRNNHLQH